MKAEYTPGPWKAKISGEFSEVTYRSGVVVGWKGFDMGPRGRRAANARLIAKAPEMHALLKTIAKIRLDGEEDPETECEVEMDIDSAFGLLSDIVTQARSLLGMEDKDEG